jgi:hypothetical protein
MSILRVLIKPPRRTIKEPELVTTWFHMYYFIVWMSSLLFYNVENSCFFKQRKNPRCVQTFNWYYTFVEFQRNQMCWLGHRWAIVSSGQCSVTRHRWLLSVDFPVIMEKSQSGLRCRWSLGILGFVREHKESTELPWELGLETQRTGLRGWYMYTVFSHWTQ